MFIECFQKLYYGPMIQKVLRKTVYKRKFFLITREMHEAQYYQKKKKRMERDIDTFKIHQISAIMWLEKCRGENRTLEITFQKRLLEYWLGRWHSSWVGVGLLEHFSLVSHWERATQTERPLHPAWDQEFMSGSNQRLHIKKDLKLQRYML